MTNLFLDVRHAARLLGARNFNLTLVTVFEGTALVLASKPCGKSDDRRS